MKVILLDVRLSFPCLREPKEFKPGDGKPRYGAAFLIHSGSKNEESINNAIKAVALEAWGKKADQQLRMMVGQSNKYCYKENHAEEQEEDMSIAAYRAASQGAPKVVDMAKQDLPIESGKPYAGCYVNAIIDIWAQKGANPGIRCALNTVQFVRDGEPFSGNIPDTEGLPDLSSDLDEEDALV